MTLPIPPGLGKAPSKLTQTDALQISTQVRLGGGAVYTDKQLEKVKDILASLVSSPKFADGHQKIGGVDYSKKDVKENLGAVKDALAKVAESTDQKPNGPSIGGGGMR